MTIEYRSFVLFAYACQRFPKKRARLNFHRRNLRLKIKFSACFWRAFSKKRLLKFPRRVFCTYENKIVLVYQRQPIPSPNVFISQHLWHETRRLDNVDNIHGYNNVINVVHWLKWNEQHYDQLLSSWGPSRKCLRDAHFSDWLTFIISLLQ